MVIPDISFTHGQASQFTSKHHFWTKCSTDTVADRFRRLLFSTFHFSPSSPCVQSLAAIAVVSFAFGCLAGLIGILYLYLFCSVLIEYIFHLLLRKICMQKERRRG